MECISRIFGNASSNSSIEIGRLESVKYNKLLIYNVTLEGGFWRSDADKKPLPKDNVDLFDALQHRLPDTVSTSQLMDSSN